VCGLYIGEALRVNSTTAQRTAVKFCTLICVPPGRDMVLGLISIGVFIGKKIYFLEHRKTTADWMTSQRLRLSSGVAASDE